MIFFDIIHQFFVLLFNLASNLPSFTVLPFGMTDALLRATNVWYSFLATVWPLQIVWTCFLWYLTIKGALLFWRAIFGARVPDGS